MRFSPLGIVILVIASMFAASPVPVSAEWKEVSIQKPYIKMQQAKVQVDVVSFQALENWNDGIKSRTRSSLPHIECAAVAKPRSVYLCAADTLSTLNLAFNRISTFAEGGGKTSKWNIVSYQQSTFERSLHGICGHDLRSGHIRAFKRVADQVCKQRHEFCPSQEEDALFKKVLNPLLQSQRDFIVLAYSQDRSDWRETLAHEIHHAQFFLSQAYRDAVDLVWRDLNRKGSGGQNQKDLIEPFMQQRYDLKDDYLIKNEFQAYLLDQDADLFGERSDLLETYLKLLSGYFQTKHVTPIHIPTSSP